MHTDKKDAERGLYEKFKIHRVDGRDQAEGDAHWGCRYFVLDLDHDPYALAALWSYANACEREFPILSRDLRMSLGDWARGETPDA